MNTIEEFLTSLRESNIHLWAEGDGLRYRAGNGALTADLRGQIVARKPEIINFLNQATEVCAAVTTGIQPLDRNADLPLSFSQQRLWFLDQMGQCGAAYNLAGQWQLNGPLNHFSLQHSLTEIVRRHEILRTSLQKNDGEPTQFITDAEPVDMPTVDLSNLGRKDRSQVIQISAGREQKRLFDLSQAPMIRFSLLFVECDHHVLFKTIHHIAYDGWSKQVFARELSLLYNAFSSGESSPLVPLPVQYADFVVWQRQWLTGVVLERQLNYWRARLRDLPFLELPTDHPRPETESFQGDGCRFYIPEEENARLKALSREHGATLYMTLLAAFQALLFRYTGQERIAVGSPIANRNRTEIEGLIGFFVNSLVMCTDVDGDLTFSELLHRVRETALGAYAHQDLPFERLVEELNPERDRSRNPLFQVIFAMQQYSEVVREFSLDRVKVSRLTSGAITTRFDLAIHMWEEGNQLNGVCSYNVDLFEKSTIERMLSHLETLLASAANNPNQQICSLPLLSDPERQQLLVDWNDTVRDYPREKTVVDLFEEQVAETPTATALVFGGKSLSYTDLNIRANQLAYSLIDTGVRPETIVGICLERSFEMIVGLLAILKAGGAYLPLDPEYPEARLALMLDDASTPILITHTNYDGRFIEFTGEKIFIDLEMAGIESLSTLNLEPRSQPNNLAYVLYTSGSTGQPKGTLIPQQGIVRLVHNPDYADFGEDEVFLQYAPITFDAATFEIWGALLNGSKLVLAPARRLGVDELGRMIQKYGITTLWLTAGLFHLMVDEFIDAFSNIRQLLAGGEQLSADRISLFKKRHPRCRLINGYGPTENTTFTCCHTFIDADKLEQAVPIGRPIANTQVYVLDANLQLVPIGVPGELYIAGDGLARGYLNRPDLTAERFIILPGSRLGRADDEPMRLYRSGDYVRWLEDGNLAFLGRFDHQVKIRGHRIELGEIEAVLSRHPTVGDAAISVYERNTDDKFLAAFIVPAPDSNPLESDWRLFLSAKLPRYMVPSVFCIVDSLPLTATGKVDRRKLESHEIESTKNRDDVESPTTPTEIQLTRIWESVLGTHPISVNDNFFDIGGHSLLAVKLFAEIERKFGCAFPLSTLFSAPTISEFARIIEDTGYQPSWNAQTPIQPHGRKSPLFCIHGGGGEVLMYNDLAKYLDPGRPILALKGAGWDGRRVPETSVEQLAADYLKEILTIQGTGPYYLIGYCVGGLIAYEIAQQLQTAGNEIALLALVETGNPSRWTPKQRGIAGGVKRQARRIRSLDPGQKSKYLVNEVKRLTKLNIQRTKMILEMKYQRAVTESLHNQDQALPFALRNQYLLKFYSEVGRRYRPELYDGKMLVFQGSETSHDLRERWEGMTTGGVDFEVIPGDHGTIVKEPNVQVLGEKLKYFIENQ